MSDVMFATHDPIGRPLAVAAMVRDDATPWFAPSDGDAIASHYARHGYVVVRGVVPAALCQQANAAFDEEAKADSRPFYRLSGLPERHTWTQSGYMLQGLRDIQSLDRRRYGNFRRFGLDIVAHPVLQRVVTTVLGERGKVVQTMYFEGNPSTQPHHDSYYLDAEKLGSMVAAWVSCEEIGPGAGRFFVCPGSHLIQLPSNAGAYNIADHHDLYLDAVADAIRNTPLEVHAPALSPGDVLLWSSRTIHGSLATDTFSQSRRSFTAHYIPESMRFLQWQHRMVPLNLADVGGTKVHHPKDQNRVRHRLRYLAETTLPGPTVAAKRFVSARLLRRRLRAPQHGRPTRGRRV